MGPGLVIGALVVSVIYSYRTQRNIAPIAVSLSFLFGCGVLGMAPRQLIQGLPISIMFNIFAITFFFGFAIENGTLQKLTERILQPFGDHPALILPALFFIGVLVALAGAGVMAAAFISSLAFAVADRVKLPPTAVYTAAACGTVAGSNFPYSAGGVVMLSLMQDSPFRDDALVTACLVFAFSLVLCTALFALTYVFFGCWKCQRLEQMESEPFTPVQIKTLWLIGIVTASVLLPKFGAEVLHLAALRELADKLDVGFVMMCGGFLAGAFGLADDKQVIRKRVPWTTIVMLGGMSMLMFVGKSCGMLEMIVGLVEKRIPKALIPALLAMVAGVMSMFSSAISVVMPTLFPLILPLSESLGVAPRPMILAIFIGATVTGISPLSTTGSMVLAGCRGEENRGRLFYQVIPLPFIMLVLTVLLCAVLTLICGRAV